MAEKDKKKDEAPGESKIDTKKDESTVDKKKGEEKAAVKVEAPKDPGPPMSFDRWLSAIGKPPHWKHGMAKFADIRGKKTADQWAAIFKAY